MASGASRRTPTTSAPRTGVYVICARNVRRTGRAGRSRAQVDFFADVTPPDGTTNYASVPDLNTLRILQEEVSSWGKIPFK